ncbi:MAG TPA: 2-oxo-4-hydroxy-4-carboxy-5-ureidoimidazoline decarboxylase [Candidatus Aquilonibacter sp.]|nr:2-oxo-4-hydroxy-4-carboxy-5-ureidoimidazoline decarboxylase [Candidatus Aquilonibacter sp.]
MTPEEILDEWNRLDDTAAAQVILPCNGSSAWAQGVARRRPLADAQQMFAASDCVWRRLSEQDWQDAFDSHPRLGEQNAKAATRQSLNWSSQEQSAAQPDDAIREALAKANREYEAKFGRIFLLCATGRSAAEILEVLRTRMTNDAAAELHEAAEQQRLITRLRLRKWLQMPPLTCAELVASLETEAA